MGTRYGAVDMTELSLQRTFTENLKYYQFSLIHWWNEKYRDDDCFRKIELLNKISRKWEYVYADLKIESCQFQNTQSNFYVLWCFLKVAIRTDFKMPIF